MNFRVNSFFGHFQVDINENSPKEDICRVFNSGNCHSFALAVNKLTGWPLYACFRPVEEHDGIPSHVFVQDPAGNFVDVDGKHTPEQMASLIRGEVKPINPWHIRAWVRKFNKTNNGYIPTRVKDALPYAKKVLDSLHANS